MCHMEWLQCGFCPLEASFPHNCGGGRAEKSAARVPQSATLQVSIAKLYKNNLT